MPDSVLAAGGSVGSWSTRARDLLGLEVGHLQRALPISAGDPASAGGPAVVATWLDESACEALLGRRRVRSTLLIAVVSALVMMLVWVSSVAVAAEGHAGRPLAEVLERLDQSGLAVVFSTALVRPDMIVVDEPKATQPRAILDEILAPFGLDVREGPGGQLVVVRARRSSGRKPLGSILGRVSCESGSHHLAGVVISVVGTKLAARVGEDGRFRVSSVPAGLHTLQAESPAFPPQVISNVRVRPGVATRVGFRLEPTPPFVSEIVVTPSLPPVLEEHLEPRHLLSYAELDEMPHLADDLLRAIRRQPGTSGGDLSARFNVRGGMNDEVLVVLDGAELYEPFHLKDFQSLFSTIDAAAVGGVELITGGFPAEYGDRMSAVMRIDTATPASQPAISLGASTISARVQSAGLFDEGRGQWLVSGRAWYPDALLDSDAVSGKILSDYFDLLAKVEHTVGQRSVLSLDLLSAYDDLGYDTADSEEVESIRARDQSHQLWLNLRTQWSQSLLSETVLCLGRITRRRIGGVDDIVEGTLALADRRSFAFSDLKQGWTLGLGDRHLLKWGLDVKHQEAGYRYSRHSTETTPVAIAESPPGFDQLDIDLSLNGESYGAYVADRARLGRRLMTEVGLRWDRQQWLGDHQLSPRFNLRYQAGERTALRLAWGRFYQAQRLNEVQVEDGVTELHPAQLAEQWQVGIEHTLSNGTAARLEAYVKKLRHPSPRFENLFNPIELFPEAQDDRVRIEPRQGRVRGVELLVEKKARAGLGWWLSYALSRAEDEIDGVMVPRTWDQRHAAGFGVDLRMRRGVHISAIGTYHSGWPTTAVTAEVVGWHQGEPELELVYGPRNRARLPEYYRLDLRASKHFGIGDGDLTLFVEIINLTNRRNICCSDDLRPAMLANGSVAVLRDEETWAPLVPSVGVRWQLP